MADIMYELIAVVVLAGILFVASTIDKGKRARLAAMTPEARQRILDKAMHGPLNPVMVCPHCLTLGEVRTKPVMLDKGISGGKAAAAVLTAGVSILATGLARKEEATQAWCGACTNSWRF